MLIVGCKSVSFLVKLMGIIPSSIEEEVRSSYLSYAMSVIVSRAIPDMRDGLKPVHRRILYSMYESGCFHNSSYRKSAKIVGEVMGKYHPHGDSAIYDALVRMAQDFSLRVPLIDGQGNFGSIDGDPPAAMRYTESRLSEASHYLLMNIDEEVVSFADNYDASAREPEVLPASYPNVLINGVNGVAVGMATNIPPHNLGEVVSAVQFCLRNGSISADEVCNIIRGPDFPTGGIILNGSVSRKAAELGLGTFVVRAKTHFEDLPSGRKAIIVDELPYQVNKARMIEHIAQLVTTKKLEGISDLRDESDREGIRAVIELKKGANQELILNKLFKMSSMQMSFSMNTVVLKGNMPLNASIVDIIEEFVNFRKTITIRRTEYKLGKARAKIHTLIGLAIALVNIDKVISIIKLSSDSKEATASLIREPWIVESGCILETTLLNLQDNELVDGRCHITEAQAKAIIDMKLYRLTSLEKGKLEAEIQLLIGEIESYMLILSSGDKLIQTIYDDLEEVKSKFSTPRKTEITDSAYKMDDEDFISKEDVMVIVTCDGYIKRVPLASYKSQARGGKGRTGQSLRGEDVVSDLFVANTHDEILLFSDHGRVYKKKVYEVPSGEHTGRGRFLKNIVSLDEDELVSSILPVPKSLDLSSKNVVFVTKQGKARRNLLSDFEYVPSGGKIAIKLSEDDSLVGVKTCDNEDLVFLSSKNGKALCFVLGSLRLFKGRNSSGIIGMRLNEGDSIVGVSIIKSKGVEDVHILSITENGFGKRSTVSEYPVISRGGKGVINIDVSKRNGCVVSSFAVAEHDHVVLMTNKGKVIRTPVRSIRITGRSAKGVVLLKTSKDESVASVAKVEGGGLIEDIAYEELADQEEH